MAYKTGWYGPAATYGMLAVSFTYTFVDGRNNYERTDQAPIWAALHHSILLSLFSEGLRVDITIPGPLGTE